VFESLLNAFRAPDIRRRILFVLGILVVYRLLAQVPLPASTARRWPTSSRTTRPSGSWTCSRRRAVAAVHRRPGDEPVHQRLDHHAAHDGRDPVAPGAQPARASTAAQRLNQYTRYLTVPMALLQAFGILSALSAQDVIIGGFGLGKRDELGPDVLARRRRRAADVAR
jgi:preprotein translocase subunit SecY